MARARWSDSHRREFQNGLWPVWAVLAVLAWVNVALQLTHSGARWETLLAPAECCRSTVRNRCVTNRLVGGLCDSAWLRASFWAMRGCPPRSRPRRCRRTR